MWRGGWVGHREVVQSELPKKSLIDRAQAQEWIDAAADRDGIKLKELAPWGSSPGSTPCCTARATAHASRLAATDIDGHLHVDE